MADRFECHVKGVPLLNADEKHCSADFELTSEPIFILGIMQRSGTNFLHDLLCLHPGCHAGGVIWEDFLVAHSDRLVACANSVYRHWNPAWRVEEVIGPCDVLCNCIGDGLISFLNLQVTKMRSCHTPNPKHNSEPLSKSAPKRLVTKTPSVKNLRHFFRLFPHAYLLVVIRDGRSVVESGIKSFNWGCERAMRKWADAARTVIHFDKDLQNANHKCLIVRYEDLYNATKKELTKIFAFLGLNAETYDFDAATSLPIKGSSELRVHGEKKIHWRPVDKTASFNPIMRWSHWTRPMHERFNWIAGDYLSQLGYKKKMEQGNRVLWAMFNIMLDIKWKMRKGLPLKLRKKS